MVNITHKSNTLRKAVATATVVFSSSTTTAAIANKQVPKGDVFEFSRAAGLLAIKKTSDLIPDCHPLPIEYAAISFDLQELALQITVEVHTIYKTGVEVEAMHGASLTALTIYDMLKPIDKGVEISSIKLVSKKGGKSDQRQALEIAPKTAVIICSDSVAAGKQEDRTGNTIASKLENLGIQPVLRVCVPDSIDEIRKLAQTAKEMGCQLAIFAGGTGLSTRDLTPEALAPLIDRPIPGIMEAARQYGQQRTPFAMLSRSSAGMMGEMLVLSLPGSPHAVAEYLDVLLPAVFHIFPVLTGLHHG